MSYSKTFICNITKYVLLDSDKTIRATSMNLIDICEVKKHYGWGTIHKCKYDNEKGILTIGEKVE